MTGGQRPTVLFVCDRLVLGGAQRLIARLCAACRAAGWRVELLAQTTPAPPDSAVLTWFSDAVDTLTQLGATDNARRLALMTRPDVTAICYSTPSLTAWGAADVAAIRRDIRQTMFLFNQRDLTPFKPMSSAFDLVIAESLDVVDHLGGEACGLTGARLIPSCAPPARFTARPDRGLPLHVGFIGRMDPGKNPLSVLSMAAALPRGLFRFSFAGEGPLAGKVRRRVWLGRIRRPLRYLGPLSEPALDALWAELDVIILPSVAEGRPLILQEAQWRGVAVLASNVGGIPEIVTHDETGLLCAPGSVPEFAAQLMRLATEPGLRDRLVSAARARSERDEPFGARLGRYVAAITGSER